MKKIYLNIVVLKKFKYGKADKQNRIGQVTGLAWTQVGGELLTIEVSTVKGKGRQVKTGSLGDVMQESIQSRYYCCSFPSSTFRSTF